MTRVEQFKAQLAAKREAQGAALTAEITLAGITFVGRRVPLRAWTLAGRVPQSLALILESGDPGEDGDFENQVGREEAAALLAFEQDLIRESVVEPKIVFERRPLAEGEVWSGDLPEDFLMAVIRWAMSGSPGVPVATEGGDVPLDAVRTFRQDGVGPEAASGAGAHGAAVQPEAVSTARNSGW